MPTLAALAARPTVERYTFPTNPNDPGAVLDRVNATEATQLVRDHLAADPRLRNVTADGYGTVTLWQGDQGIRLTPGRDAQGKRLTERQADDLVAIAHAGLRASLALEPRHGTCIHAGLTRIPPAATERLVDRGWLATAGTDEAAVDLSLMGVVALQWRGLKADGVEPRLWGQSIAEIVVDHFGPEV
ncbi:hypothetical protein B0E38_01795 [Streptomyces sp. 111WW2]|uniref:hypothetical protein n=1 Tax=Streptomyces sp. 111WW2 TaxID=1945515 RepID=UPI000D0C750D|nr:hypothetical protein [Streptomyces sp. 111WW2]PSK57950.1 hypothetical protein B0E38_01795 [Streptomyces sp. 111WW2]